MVFADHPAASSVATNVETACEWEWSMVPLIRWALVPLLKTLMWVSIVASVASRGLSLKSPLLGIHLLALIVNHNSVVHECLEVGVGAGHKLQLETII